jgi:hypothetical protein
MQVSIDKDCKFALEMNDKEKGELINSFCKIYNQLNKMSKWFDDGTVSIEQKEPYFQQLRNMVTTVELTLNLMLAAKIDVKEVLETMSLPF